MNKLVIVGVGPGSKDYLLPIAKRQIQKADCLIGARRMLSQFRQLKKEKIYLEGNFSAAILYIKENLNIKRIVALVSGDPGLYSFLRPLKRVLNKKDYVVIPGISVLQLAFAKLGESWEDAEIISLHGRSLDGLAKKVNSSSKIFLFTDSKFPPQRIAEYLLNKKIENRRVVVFENLSYPEERIIETNLKDLRTMKDFGLCVMLIKK